MGSDAKFAVSAKTFPFSVPKMVAFFDEKGRFFAAAFIEWVSSARLPILCVQADLSGAFGKTSSHSPLGVCGSICSIVTSCGK
jgi:hypothetical protein